MRYAVVFNGDTELNDEPGDLLEFEADPNEDVNAPKLKHIIVKALKEEPSLPLDIETLNFETGKSNIKDKRIAWSRILNLHTCFSIFHFAWTTLSFQ